MLCQCPPTLLSLIFSALLLPVAFWLPVGRQWGLSRWVPAPPGRFPPWRGGGGGGGAAAAAAEPSAGAGVARTQLTRNARKAGALGRARLTSRL